MCSCRFQKQMACSTQYVWISSGNNFYLGSKRNKEVSQIKIRQKACANLYSHLLFLLCVCVCVCVHVLKAHITHTLTYTFLRTSRINLLRTPKKSKHFFFLDIQGPVLIDIVAGFQFCLNAPDRCKT